MKVHGASNIELMIDGHTIRQDPNDPLTFTAMLAKPTPRPKWDPELVNDAKVFLLCFLWAAFGVVLLSANQAVW